MASFASASQALKCAVAMQRAFAEYNQTADEPILVRMGLNAGEPIAEAEDLFGTAVNLAARIAAQAAGGQIIVSSVVRELAAGKGFLFGDRGEWRCVGSRRCGCQVRWETERFSSRPSGGGNSGPANSHFSHLPRDRVDIAAMEPRIQYARTADGVSIAFWTLGEGTPVVHMPNLPWSHIQLEWQNPECRRW
jgi:hypothetical protein